MELSEITKKVSELARDTSGEMGSKVKFVFQDGCVFIDDTVNPPIVNNEDSDAHCTITINNDDFKKLLDKELSSMGAFMSGKMKIDGDMTVAMKLSSMFGQNIKSAHEKIRTSTTNLSHQALNLARLPIPPHALNKLLFSLCPNFIFWITF